MCDAVSARTHTHTHTFRHTYSQHKTHEKGRHINLKKMVTTQKLRVVFYLVGIFKTSSMRDSISSNVARTLRRRRGEEPGYIEGLQQRAGSLNIKRVLQIKEN